MPDVILVSVPEHDEDDWSNWLSQKGRRLNQGTYSPSSSSSPGFSPGSEFSTDALENFSEFHNVDNSRTRERRLSEPHIHIGQLQLISGSKSARVRRKSNPGLLSDKASTMTKGHKVKRKSFGGTTTMDQSSKGKEHKAKEKRRSSGGSSPVDDSLLLSPGKEELVEWFQNLPGESPTATTKKKQQKTLLERFHNIVLR